MLKFLKISTLYFHMFMHIGMYVKFTESLRMQIKHFDNGKISFKVHPPKYKCAFPKSHYLQESRWKFKCPMNLETLKIINLDYLCQRHFCTSSISHWICMV